MIAILLALQTIAAAVAPPPSAVTVPPVVVTAPHLSDVPELIHQFGYSSPGERLARWRLELCPKVVGLSARQDAYVEDRLRAIGKAAEIVVGGRYCEPDLIIVATPDLDKVTRALVKRGSRVLGPGASLLQHSQDRARFLEADGRPFHEFTIGREVASSVGGDGSPLQISASIGDEAFAAQGGPLVVHHAYDSRILANSDYSFLHRVIVVDVNRFRGLDMEQFSAYVALIGLAQVDDTSDLHGVQTILNVVDPGLPQSERPKDLTFWDRAYLGALYKARSQNTLGEQRGAMVEAVTQAVRDRTALPREVGLQKASDTTGSAADAPVDPKPSDGASLDKLR